MDSERLKSVITEINSLFKKNYNLLSFDLLSSEQLLQILSDTLSQVDGSAPIDLRQEMLEDTVLRILEMLRILKYKLADDASPAKFRQGLVQGDKNIIHPILEWLVTNMADLKKRSYLAQYLVKLDIPPEIAADPDIAYLYEQYESHIEEFKNVHKESEALKETALSVAELRSDIKAMEAEKESVVKKIEKLRRRVENFSDKGKFLEAAKALRIEREKGKEIIVHEEQQQNLAAANEQKLRRLSMQLRDLRQHADRDSPQDVIRRLEEECSVNGYLSQQKLPAEIRVRKDEIQMFEMVLNEPSLSRAHLDDLNFKIQQISSQVTQMVESQIAEQGPGEDKNAPFRQQAAIIARKKDAKAEQLAELRSQLSQTEEEVTFKQKQLHEVAGEMVLRGDDLKKYVSRLRGRGALYKKSKALLAALKTEAGVLTRTLEILATRDQSVMEALAEEEAKHGVKGYLETRTIMENVSEAKSDVDTSKGKTLEEMSKLVVELTHKVSVKKTQLEPLIAELRPLREEHAELKDQYDQMKRVYDSTASGLDNAAARLQQEVERLQKEMDSSENEIQRLQQENAKAEEDLRKVGDEMKLYVSGSADAKKNSLREQLQQKISEQEKIAKQLKDEQMALKDLQTKNMQQVRFWKELETLMKCKVECLEEDKQNTGIVRREKGMATSQDMRPRELSKDHSPSVERSESSSCSEKEYDLDDFDFLQTIGTGTFGRVCLCREKSTMQFRALKIMSISDVIRLKQVEHVKNEKHILEEMHHPFIVKLYSSWRDNSSLYMLFDYVCGGELFSYLRNSGRFTLGTANFYACEVILALEYLHSQSVVYRDLKPENLLLDREGHIKIIDFGFAKKLTDRTWTLCGTPEYLAPEIIQSKGHNKAVDWWALGVLIYEMLTGHPPFFDSNPFGIYEKILAGKIEWSRLLDPVAKDLIKKLLVQDRTKRLGNMKNGAEDVKRHRWFKETDWTEVFNRQLKPPIVPQIKFEGDTRNFDYYPEADWRSKPSLGEIELRLFEDF